MHILIISDKNKKGIHMLSRKWSKTLADIQGISGTQRKFSLHVAFDFFLFFFIFIIFKAERAVRKI